MKSLRNLPLMLMGCCGFASALEMDFGDLPDAPYPTKLTSNGARHVVSQAIFLGTTVPDSELDAISTPTADGDDMSGSDDENAIDPASLRPVPGFLMYMSVRATNVTGSAAALSGFVDWNNDGDFLDAGETSSMTVPDGAAAAVFELPWTVPSGAVTTAPVAVRLRLTTAGVVPPTGAAPDGEVEDFFINVLAQGIDCGDLPDSAAGTSAGIFGTGTPPDYQTLLADGGPSHVMRAGLYFTNDGPDPLAHLDAEPDGLPSAAADGDDVDGEDDEYGLYRAVTSATVVNDGTHSRLALDMTTSLAVTNVTGDDAVVVGFIDWNSDGDFDDAGEQSAPITVPGDGSVTSVNPLFSADLPLLPSPMSFTTGARFRISTDAGLGSGGPASDGEVHDELVSVTFTYSTSNPDTAMDYGDLNDSRYPTMWSNNGARHVVTQTLFMGNTTPDGEPDAWASVAATGDDLHGSDDEDGFQPSSVTVIRGASMNFPVKVSNITGGPAILYGFVDWNDDGDFLDANEKSSVPVPAGSAGVFVLLPWSVPVTASTSAPVAVRLRLTTDIGVDEAGRANDGEVEDHLVSVIGELDFGDLPDPGYPTTLASNGAAHVFSANVFLGSNAPDLESDGAASTAADGDDTLGSDDEDGVDAASLNAVPGFLFHMPVTATNLSGTSATISAFIDWNADGDFADADETVTQAVPNGSSGTTFLLLWNVPLTASTAGPAAVRIRLATGGPRPPVGVAPDGEVEDYFINVLSQGVDYGDLPDSASGTAPGVHGTASPPDYRTLLADGGPSHVMRPGLYFTNDGTGSLAHLDAENDGQPSANADGDDLAGEDDEYGLFYYITRETVIIDGIHSEIEMEMGASLATTNTTGDAAYVSGFIDVNSDGDFDDPGEQAPVESVPGDGSVPTVNSTFTFRIRNLTPSPMSLTHATRFRITTDSGIGSDGPASDGEVHDELVDYTITFTPPDPLSMDYGDLDSTRYRTLWADDGARHVIGQSLFIGATPPDGEVDGYASSDATGDDSHGTDDEDTLDTGGNHPYRGNPFPLPVKVTNSLTGAATLYGFADWNDDGDFLDAGESATVAVPPGSAGTTVSLVFNVPAAPAATGEAALRLRLSTDTGLAAFGRANDGEVEDHVLTVRGGWDFGDLPDSAAGTAPGVVTNFSTVSQGDYRTTLADNGPRHLMRPDLVLFNDADPTGIHIDGEADGHPSADADGDNLDADDDEQVLYCTLTRQTLTNANAFSVDVSYDLLASLAVKNETGSTAYLTGFLDANNDGDFSDPGETASISVPSAAGYSAVILTFSPSLQLNTHITSWTAKLPVRFRLSTLSGLGPDGPAPDGEVEDYMVSIGFTTSRWWPLNGNGLPAHDFLADLGTPIRLSAGNAAPALVTGTDFKWKVGEIGLSSEEVIVDVPTLQNLGTGLTPYSVSARFGPRSLGSHAGWIKVLDLAQFREFMGENGLTGTSASPGEDADDDGTSNFTEFAFGTDPSAHTPPPGMATRIVEETGTRYFTGVYQRRTGGTLTGTKYATPDVVYAPAASGDLTIWSEPVFAAPVPGGLPPAPSGYEWGAVRIPIAPASPARGFLHVETGPP